jgi:hypothetical protein
MLYLTLWFNIIFFVLYLFLFLGIKLCCPNSWANKVNQADRGGIGILFMALALAIVSFLLYGNSGCYWLKPLLRGSHPSLGCSVFH